MRSWMPLCLILRPRTLSFSMQLRQQARQFKFRPATNRPDSISGCFELFPNLYAYLILIPKLIAAPRSYCSSRAAASYFPSIREITELQLRIPSFAVVPVCIACLHIFLYLLFSFQNSKQPLWIVLDSDHLHPNTSPRPANTRSGPA
jgi:hypothetical protein